MQGWANLWPTETVARIDAGSGRLLGLVDLRGLRDRSEGAAAVPAADAAAASGAVCEADVLNGIARLGEEDPGEPPGLGRPGGGRAGPRVLVGGKCWRRSFEIRLGAPAPGGDGGEVTVLPASARRAAATSLPLIEF